MNLSRGQKREVCACMRYLLQDDALSAIADGKLSEGQCLKGGSEDARILLMAIRVVQMFEIFISRSGKDRMSIFGKHAKPCRNLIPTPERLRFSPYSGKPAQTCFSKYFLWRKIRES